MTGAIARFPFPDHPGPEPAPEVRDLPANRPAMPAALPTGLPITLVTRHADIQAILSDDRFSRELASGHGMVARTRESLALNGADPPDHTRRRRLLTHAFTGLRAERLRTQTRHQADQLLRRLDQAGVPADLVAGFALPLTVGVVFRLIGAPPEDITRIRGWVDPMMSTTAFSPEEVKAGQQGMFDYFAGLLDSALQRHARGQEMDNVIGELASCVADGSLGHGEAVHLGYGLLIAGYETTSNQLGVCAFLLATRPELAERLRATPADLPGAVEEMLRWTSLSSVGLMPRMAREDVVLGGETIRAGQVVIPVVDAANRDPAVFTDPETLVIDRARNPHLSFGHGRHHCLGAALARMELQVAVAALVERWPQLRLAVPPEELRWREGMFVRGLKQLPVLW